MKVEEIKRAALALFEQRGTKDKAYWQAGDDILAAMELYRHRVRLDGWFAVLSAYAVHCAEVADMIEDHRFSWRSVAGSWYVAAFMAGRRRLQREMEAPQRQT